MDDLGKPVHGFVEPVVEAMDEHKHLPLRARLPCGDRQRRDESRLFDWIGRDRHEALSGISRR
nr:hypothetical protein [Bradyrhizobium canariense]